MNTNGVHTPKTRLPADFSATCSETAIRLFRLVAPVLLLEPLLRLRGGQRRHDLDEMQFFVLAALRSRGALIVGDIRRLLGVRTPALMTRIIASLENREIPLITSQRKAGDRRKIDVCLTEAGMETLETYEECRVRKVTAMFQCLSNEELEDFSRIVAKLDGPLCPDGDG